MTDGIAGGWNADDVQGDPTGVASTLHGCVVRVAGEGGDDETEVVEWHSGLSFVRIGHRGR